MSCHRDRKISNTHPCSSFSCKATAGVKGELVPLGSTPELNHKPEGYNVQVSSKITLPITGMTIFKI